MTTSPLAFQDRPLAWYPTISSAYLHPYFPATTGFSLAQAATHGFSFPYTVSLNNFYFNSAHAHLSNLQRLPQSNGCDNGLVLTPERRRHSSLPSSPHSPGSECNQTFQLDSSTELVYSPKSDKCGMSCLFIWKIIKYPLKVPQHFDFQRICQQNWKKMIRCNSKQLIYRITIHGGGKIIEENSYFFKKLKYIKHISYFNKTKLFQFAQRNN